ncbi:hypothetical protein [Pseudomonas sp. UFMG81]|uniref:hypothetical protein n=1 Tax=Pseudomonas sp. UFMG81 TaxID=2745936 RepID=UPI00188E4481|nr:hypothetical protein [Pseudomonas sp. UFMG81]
MNLKSFSAFESDDSLAHFDQTVLSALVVHTLALQAHLALTPTLPDREVPVEDPAQWLEEHLPQWQADTAQWWEEQTSSLQEQLRQLSSLLIRAQAMRHGAPKADIEALLPDAPEEPVLGRVMLHTPDGIQVRIPGCLVLAHNLFDDEEPLLLFGLGLGTWFARPQSVADKLLERLRDDERWLLAVTAAEREALMAAEHVELVRAPQEDGLEDYLLKDMRTLQLQLVVQALHAEAGDADAAVVLEPLLEGLQRQVADILALLRNDQAPEWLRNLSGDERQRLEALDTQLNDAEALLVRVSGHSDFHDYAVRQIKMWLLNEGVEHVEPADVALHVRHDFTADAQVQVTTLLDWVCAGAYHGERLAIEIRHDDLREALGGDGLSRMAHDLQLRQRYVDEVEGIYQNDQVVQLLAKALDTKLRLSMLAADFQGLDRNAVALLQTITREGWAQDPKQPDITVGRLSINGMQLLTDHLYLHDNDTHVLYAPGSPMGDFQVFNSALSMSQQIGLLCAIPHGREYLLEHVLHDERVEMNTYLKLIERLPQEWSEETVVVEPLPIASWGQTIEHWAKLRVLKIIDDLQMVRPEQLANADASLQRRVADIDHELSALLVDYQAVAEIPTFMAYARNKVSERINQYSGNRGGWIDADTVLVELEGGIRQSLTKVVASGYPADFNFSAYARFSSTVGQDLSHLNRRLIDRYIRAAKLGKGYCDEIAQTYLHPDGSAQSRPLELHRHLMGMKIQRDCLLEVQRGTLNKEHTRWLIPACLRFHAGSFVQDCQLAELQINGAGISGAYLLQSSEARGTLIYLSDGPEGRSLFTVQDFIEHWRGAPMQDWVYERIDVDDEEKIRKLNECVENNDNDDSFEQGDKCIADALQVLHNIKDLSDALRERIKLLLDEAQRDAYSAARRIAQVLWSTVKLVGDVVALVYPPASVVIGFINAGIGLYRSLVALRDGDRLGAIRLLFTSLTELPGFTGVVSHYAGRLFTYGSKLWSIIFPGPSSSLSLRLKKICEYLKALYERYKLEVDVAKVLYSKFDEQMALLTERAALSQLDQSARSAT